MRKLKLQKLILCIQEIDRLKHHKKQLDVSSLTETSYISLDVTIDSSEQRKKEEDIFDQIIEQMPVDNDKCYIEYEKNTNTFKIKEDTYKLEKSYIVASV